ncbi:MULTISPECIES: hypothetical protein [Lysinibacillus]|uniref:Uncharacterized protein n=1 Tax=Lysinibacillus capsici TaxID=2115968 RepID=A0ABY8KL58_9BACI|nr:hypothetical protein [Lysinibacillus capsici]WGF40227.1 hypothetical protein QBO96_08145 [Lysinibacillus capsici]
MSFKAQLKVIDGIKKDKPDYFMLYLNAFINEIERANKKYETAREYDRDTLTKLIWTGVKTISVSEQTNDEKVLLESRLPLLTFINGLMALLTPKEFEKIFPIDKEFNGDKWGMKDYYYTRRYIEEFGENRVIGDEIEEYLWEYQNHTIRFYMVKTLKIMSNIRRLETGKGIMEEFLEEQGVPTYTMHEDLDNKQYIENNQTGEISEVKKPRPRYLRVVKNENKKIML